MISNEEKLEIVFRLIRKWKETPLKTFNEITNQTEPSIISDLNLKQFLIQVFTYQQPNKTKGL